MSNPRHTRAVTALTALLALTLAACDASTSRSASESRLVADTISAPEPGPRFAPFDPANFDDTSTRIDNPYLPLVPGTQLVLDGSDHEGRTIVPHRIVFTVTDQTKVIDGVRAVVAWDRDFVRRDLAEAELSFFAQDNAGNVWYLGEYSETYDGGELVGARGFLVGALPGVHAGIVMPAHPRLGMPSFSEGYAPAPILWTDRASIYKVGQRTKVPAATYSDVVVTEEYSDDETTGYQTKYYAPGVGNIRIGFLGHDPEAETLSLSRIRHLDGPAMAKLHAEVSAFDARARMYGETQPLEPTPTSAATP